MADPNLIHSEEVLPIVEATVEETKNTNEHVCNAMKKQPNKKNLDIDIEDILIEQKKDKNIKIIFNALRNNTNEARVKYKNYSICPSTKLLLYATKPKANVVECNNKIVIPSSLKEKCIRVESSYSFWNRQNLPKLVQKIFLERHVC